MGLGTSASELIREAVIARCDAVLAEGPTAFLDDIIGVIETLYLLGKLGGWPAQEAAWKLVEGGMVEIAPATTETWTAMRKLMEKYRDVPMDLAEASLVALANECGLQVVLTLDSDFEVYRPNGNRPFRMLP